MKTIKIDLPESAAGRLEEAAQQLGVTLEEFLRLSVEEKLAQLDRSFNDAAGHILTKNAELYKRLA